ncbi:MAG: 30S ribosomal protein S17 [Parcubacteria group bacterium GW2011_GWC2_39_14]|nr:MAG: 30S ribosomal protein S17 [Parcubacteria group bacterium GW2011_GWC2_39_14]KKR55478.1 MAG: 30S ribosomal protein S17 [Parcubacteria group bacterium GW2011_GWA2_40_23]
MEQAAKKISRRFEGEVVSTKMDKTAVVLVARTVRHKKYLKQYIVSRKYKAHDEKNECKVGEKVEIRECCPMSKDKKWIIVRKVK